MRNNLKKNLHEQGYLIVKNILNFKKDLKPVLNDMEFVMDCLILVFCTGLDIISLPKIFSTTSKIFLFVIKFQSD